MIYLNDIDDIIEVIDFWQRVEKNKLIYVNIMNRIKNYHEDEDIKEIRRLSNEQKHNNNISFKELVKPNVICYKSENFCTDWIESKRVSLYDTIDLCYRANNKIKKYVEDIYDLLDEFLHLSKYN